MTHKKLVLITFILLLLSFSFVSADLTSDIISYYTFDSDASDSLGINIGTVSGATLTTGSSGKIGEAYDFDGTDDDIIVSSFDFGGGGIFTISLWFYADSFNRYESVFQYGVDPGTNQNNIILQYDDRYNNNFLYKLRTAQADYVYKSSDKALNTGMWNHVYFSINGNSMTVYVNGEEATLTTEVSGGNPTVNNLNNNQIMRIGEYYDNSVHYRFDGKIDEVGIWDRALTQSEITELLYNSGSGLQYPFAKDLPINITGGYFTPNTSIYTTTSTTAYAVLNTTTNAAVNYTIYKNSVSYKTGTSTTFNGNIATLVSLTSADTKQEDIFYFTALAVNSSNYGQAISDLFTSDNITIINRITVLSNPVFNPLKLINSSNFSGYVDASDADNDIINISWNLYMNRTGSVSLVDSGTVLNQAVGTNIKLFEYDYLDTQVGDYYYFTASATDGYNTSNTVTSSKEEVTQLTIYEFTLRDYVNNSLLNNVTITINNGSTTWTKTTNTTGFVSFREDIEGITSETVNANITLNEYVNIYDKEYNKGSYTIYLNREGRIFHVTNLFDDSNITSFNVTINNGYTTTTKTTTNGQIWFSNIGSYTYTIKSTDFIDVTGSYISLIQTNYTSINEETYQHLATFTAEKKIIGTSINAFNISIPAGKEYSATNGTINAYLNLGSYNINAESTGYVSITNNYTATGTSGSDVFEFGSATLNITAIEFITGTSINNLTVILQHENGYSETKSTTTGTVSFGVVENEVWQVTISSNNYASETVNITQTGNFTSYEATLYNFNSLQLNFYDVETFELIKEQIRIEILSNTTSNVTLFNPINETILDTEQEITALTPGELITTFTFEKPRYVNSVTRTAKTGSAANTFTTIIIFFYDDNTNNTVYVNTNNENYETESEENNYKTKKVTKINILGYMQNGITTGYINNIVINYYTNFFEYDFLNPENYELRFSSEGYNPRNAFIKVLNDSTNNLTFYLSPNTTTELQPLKLINTNNQEVENGIIILQKQVSNKSVLYVTIDEVKTNFNGEVSTFVERSTTDFYRFAVLINGVAGPIMPNRNLYTGQTNFYPNVIETIQIVIDQEKQIIGFSSAFNNIIYNIEFDEEDNRTIIYTYFDGENTISGAKLLIYGRFLENTSINYTYVTTITSTGTSGTINYTLPNINNSIYWIRAYISIDEQDILIWEGYKEVNVTDKPEKNLGMFLTIIIMIFIAITTAKLGTLLSSVFTFGSLFLASILGLVSIPVSIITSLIAFSIILFVNIRSSSI